MIYAATSRCDGGRHERICGAISNDLYTWEKLGEVNGISSDARYYENKDDYPEHIAWRDPKPFYEDGVYYCVICGRDKCEPLLRRGAAALMTSRDLLHWEIKPPLFAPRAYMELECPQLYKMGGKYYLIASIIEDWSMRYWVADTLEGPYRVCGDNLLLPPGTHYAGRIARFQGRDVFACWTFAKEDGPSPFGLRETPGAPIKYIPALLEVRSEPDGRMTFASLAAWDAYAVGDAEPLFLEEPGRILDNSLSNASKGMLCSPSGMEIAATGRVHEGFTLKFRVCVKGYRAGIAFYAGSDGSAYLLELYPGENRARLVKHFSRVLPQENVWFDYAVLCETTIDLSLGAVDVLLRSVYGEIEISLAGRVRLATVSTTATQGMVGLFADCASIEMSEDEIVRMRAPENL